MAKEDFCFTYYDGDAARDMSHMNRLERGAYTDIIISQRKFGPLTLIQIKKILGKDFEDCWDSIDLVLKFQDEKYFIEWLKNSVEKSIRHSKYQSENGKKGGRPSNLKPNESELKLNESELNLNESELKPLEDGNEYADVNENEKEEGGAGETIKTGSKQTTVVTDIDLLRQLVILDKEFKHEFIRIGVPEKFIEPWLENFNKFLKHGGTYHRTEKDYRWHFSNWIRDKDFNSPQKYSLIKQPKNEHRNNFAGATGAGGY